MKGKMDELEAKIKELKELEEEEVEEEEAEDETVIDEAKRVNQERQEILEREEKLMERKEKLHAEEMVAGKGRHQPEKSQETAKEYADRIMRGEL